VYGIADCIILVPEPTDRISGECTSYAGKLTGDENSPVVRLQHWLATTSVVEEASDTMLLTSGRTQRSESKLQDYEAPTSSTYFL
jgi:hypothetical protein